MAFDDASRGGHFGRRTWLAEGLLHVDDDHRSMRGRKCIEEMQAASPGDNAIDDVLADHFIVLLE